MDVTGVKPKPVADSCAGRQAARPWACIGRSDLLKPDANAKTEATNALRRARENIKDASE